MKKILCLIEEWIGARDLSLNTRRFYEMELTRFGAWVFSQCNSFSSIGVYEVRSYLSALQYEPEDHRSQFHIRRKKALSPQSIEQSRRILHAFFEWGVRNGHMARNPFWDIGKIDPIPEKADSQRFTLSSEISKLLRAHRNELAGEDTLRAATIAHLAFWAGANREEIAKLKIKDFICRGAKAAVFLPTPDGGSTRVALPKHSAGILSSYLQFRRAKNLIQDIRSPLVASLKTNSGISGWAVRHALREWQQERLPQNRYHQVVGPRQLRQAFQRLAIKKEVQERIVATHLRIKQISLRFAPMKPAQTLQLYDVVKQAISPPEN